MSSSATQHSVNQQNSNILKFTSSASKFTDHKQQDLLRKDPEPIYHFGSFVLHKSNAALSCDNKAIALTPKAFSLLCFLIDSHGQLLSKDDIFAAVWPNVVVGDAVITVSIREIRKALGDSCKNPHYIETVPKRGFRFICQVHQQAQTEFATTTICIPQEPPALIGRETELQELNDYFSKAQQGERQVVFVSGEPGIGKSTVLAEFIAQYQDNPDIWIGSGQCFEQYAQSEAFLPVYSALEHLLEQHGEDFKQILSAYAPHCLANLSEAGTQAAVAQTTTGSLLREMNNLLEQIAQHHSVILILEDIHWCDLATVDLISMLARRQYNARLMIVGSLRSNDAIRHQHPVHHLIQDLCLYGQAHLLKPELLSAQHITRYLNNHYRVNDFPQQLGALIHQYSAGNPLFMVNVLKYFENRQLIFQTQDTWQFNQTLFEQQHYIPDSIQQVINQQLQQLDALGISILETASIASEPGGIAIQFSLLEIATLLDISLLAAEESLARLLKNCHFIRAAGYGEWPDGSLNPAYEFTHAIYQQVIYERISPMRKTMLHQQAGSCLQQAYQQNSQQVAQTLAIHFHLGHDYPNAIAYYIQSAHTNINRGCSREAISNLQISRSILGKLHQPQNRQQQELIILQLLATAITASQGDARPEVEKLYLDALGIAKQLGQVEDEFTLLFGLRSFYLIAGNIDQAQELATQQLHLAKQLNSPESLLQAHVGLSSTTFFAGHIHASHEHSLQGIKLYQQGAESVPSAACTLDSVVFCHARAGQTLWPMGDTKKALNYVQQAVAIAEQKQHPYSIVFAQLNLTLIHLYNNDSDLALKLALQTKVLAQQHHFSFLLLWATHLCAWAYAMHGEQQQAYIEIDHLLAADYQYTETTQSYLYLFLAESYYLLGDFLQGLACLDNMPETFCYAAESLHLRANLLLTQASENSITSAEQCLQQALQASRQQGLQMREKQISSTLTQLRHQQSKYTARDLHSHTQHPAGYVPLLYPVPIAPDSLFG